MRNRVPGARAVGDDERLVDQPVQDGLDVDRRHPVGGGDVLGGVEGRPVGEDRRGARTRPARRRRATRSSSRRPPRGCAGAPRPCVGRRGSRSNRSVRRSRISSTPQVPRPRRGELERQRQPVEAFADRRDRLGGLGVLVDRARGACLEERDGGVGGPGARPRNSRSRRHRRALPAGGDDVQPPAARQQLVDDRGQGAEEVLAVVEHEHGRPVARGDARPRERGVRVGDAAASMPSERWIAASHVSLVPGRGELDPPHTVGHASCERRRPPWPAASCRRRPDRRA